MSELIGSQKDDALYVLDSFFRFSCPSMDDDVAKVLAEALLSVQVCTKALALVPQPGPVNPSMAARILVEMAKQLRRGNVSTLCKNAVYLKKHSEVRIACM